MFIGFTPYLFPPTPYRLHVPDGELEELETPDIKFGVDACQVAQEFALSPDDRVPYFVIAPQNVQHDGQNPHAAVRVRGLQYPPQAHRQPRCSAYSRLNSSGQERPTIIRLQVNTGHGAGKPTTPAHRRMG